MSWRKFAELVRWLPPESALVRSRLGPAGEWGLPEQLLALLIDTVRIGNWQRGGGKESDRPRPFPRPGLEEDRRTTLTPQEMAARLVEQRRRYASRN